MTCRAWAHAALFLIVAGARSASAADAGPTKVAFLFSTGSHAAFCTRHARMVSGRSESQYQYPLFLRIRRES